MSSWRYHARRDPLHVTRRANNRTRSTPASVPFPVRHANESWMNRRSQAGCSCPTSTWCTTRSRNFAAKISRRFGVSSRNARKRPGRYVPAWSSSRRATRFSSSRRSKTSALCVPRLRRRHSRYARYRLSSVNSGWLGQPPLRGGSSIRGRTVAMLRLALATPARCCPCRCC